MKENEFYLLGPIFGPKTGNVAQWEIQLFGPILTYIDLFGHIWTDSDLFGHICTYFELNVPVLTYIDFFGPIWTIYVVAALDLI